MCRNGKSIVIHRQLGNVVAHVLSHCDSWSCPECRQRFVDRWTEHCTIIWEGAPWNVWILRTTKAEWDSAIYYRARRAGIRHLAVRHGDGLLTVFLDGRLEGAKPQRSEYAISVLRSELQACDGRKPVSSCRQWTMREVLGHVLKVDPPPEKDWTVVAVGVTREQFVETAKSLELKLQDYTEGVVAAELRHGMDAVRFVSLCRRRKIRTYTDSSPEVYTDSSGAWQTFEDWVAGVGDGTFGCLSQHRHSATVAPPETLASRPSATRPARCRSS